MISHSPTLTSSVMLPSPAPQSPGSLVTVLLSKSHSTPSMVALVFAYMMEAQPVPVLVGVLVGVCFCGLVSAYIVKELISIVKTLTQSVATFVLACLQFVGSRVTVGTSRESFSEVISSVNTSDGAYDIPNDEELLGGTGSSSAAKKGGMKRLCFWDYWPFTDSRATKELISCLRLQTKQNKKIALAVSDLFKQNNELSSAIGDLSTRNNELSSAIGDLSTRNNELASALISKLDEYLAKQGN